VKRPNERTWQHPKVKSNATHTQFGSGFSTVDLSALADKASKLGRRKLGISRASVSVANLPH